MLFIGGVYALNAYLEKVALSKVYTSLPKLYDTGISMRKIALRYVLGSVTSVSVAAIQTVCDAPEFASSIERVTG